jgi:hypothetical protein
MLFRIMHCPVDALAHNIPRENEKRTIRVLHCPVDALAHNVPRETGPGGWLIGRPWSAADARTLPADARTLPADARTLPADARALPGAILSYLHGKIEASSGLHWFHAAMRLYNSLTNSNSYTTKKVLHADMQLSSRSNDCWSTCILSAMDGLTQSYIYKRKLRNCEFIDLSRFVVDLRDRHMEYWIPYYDTYPREHDDKRSTYHQ